MKCLMLLIGMAMVSEASAQEGSEELPEGPSVADGVSFINQKLASSASTWRPCQESTILTVDEEGRLAFEIERESYCEHSMQTAHLLDLDPDAIEVANEQEMVVRVPCLDGAECGRYWEKRKTRDGENWALRDSDWRPDSQFKERTHKVTGIEIRLSSDERSARQVAEGIQYLLTRARTEPAFADAPPFGTPEETAAEGEGTP